MNELSAPVPPAPPSAPHTGYRIKIAESAEEARSGTAYILSVTSLIVWMVQYYGFHGNVPGAVSAALYVIVPTTVGYLSEHVTIKKVTL